MKNGALAYGRQRGFTLIELLTVIAIIGILAAILIPVVARVRESARGAVCASNLRQMLNGLYVFQEENGRFPAPQDESLHSGPGATLPQSINTWHGYIAPYAGFEAGVRRMWDDGISWRSDSADQTVFHCPSTWNELSPLPHHSSARLNPYYHYGLNAELPWRAYGGVGRRSGVNVDLGDLHSPSRTMAILETSDWSATYPRERTTGQALIPHGGGMNVGFYDGSVRRLSMDEFLETEREDPFWWGGY